MRAYYARVRLPHFLLVEDNDADVRTFIAIVKRIGLINTVRAFGSVREAQRFLETADDSMLPVVVFTGGAVRDDDGEDLGAWMAAQAGPLQAIPTVALTKPFEMYAIIEALKALALPERARIDSTTLTVRVELWPHGTVLADA
jgi:hypothetical protein